MVRFGVIINPASRKMRQEGAIERLKKVAQGYDVHFELTEYSEKPTEEIYKSALKNLLAKDVDILLVASGDGGHHLVDTALLSLTKGKTTIPQANLRGGTMNIRADSSKLPTRKLQQIALYTATEFTLKQFLETYGNTKPEDLQIVNRTLIKVENDGKNQVGFSFSSGVMVKFFEKFYEKGGGHRKALQLVLQSTLSFPKKGGLIEQYLEPVHGDVFIDNRPLYKNKYNILMRSLADEIFFSWIRT